MERSQAEAVASVICRVIDYYHARSTAERNTFDEKSKRAQAIRLIEAQANVADALEAIPDEG